MTASSPKRTGRIDRKGGKRPFAAGARAWIASWKADNVRCGLHLLEYVENRGVDTVFSPIIQRRDVPNLFEIVALNLSAVGFLQAVSSSEEVEQANQVQLQSPPLEKAKG